jgi:hypothetical protein
MLSSRGMMLSCRKDWRHVRKVAACWKGYQQDGSMVEKVAECWKGWQHIGKEEVGGILAAHPGAIEGTP